jgi:DNA-binding HxlR family transcriptional regulator
MATKPITNKTTDQEPVETSAPHMCPRYEHATQLLGKRWTGLLLNALMQGSSRFCELTSLVEGLSDRVLSDRLRELEAEGIVKRIVFPQIPVRVEYQLTEKGHALKPVVDAIHTWAEQWVELAPEIVTSLQHKTEEK